MSKKSKTREVFGDILLEGCFGSLAEGCFSGGCMVFSLFAVIVTGFIIWWI